MHSLGHGSGLAGLPQASLTAGRGMGGEEQVGSKNLLSEHCFPNISCLIWYLSHVGHPYTLFTPGLNRNNFLLREVPIIQQAQSCQRISTRQWQVSHDINAKTRSWRSKLVTFTPAKVPSWSAKASYPCSQNVN